MRERQGVPWNLLRSDMTKTDRQSRRVHPNGTWIALLLVLFLGACSRAYLPSDSFLNDARNGRTDAVIASLGEGRDVNFRGEHQETALMYAASHGHLDTVQILLARGAAIDARDKKGLTALMAALSNPRASPVAQELIDQGADIHAVSREGHTALLLAVANDMPEVAERLTALGADVDAKVVDGPSVLQLAEKHGNQHLLTLLREAQAKKAR